VARGDRAVDRRPRPREAVDNGRATVAG
jgi:hypothetical protein